MEKITAGISMVEVLDICHHDGSPLDRFNWRTDLIGAIMACRITGGFGSVTPFFKHKFRRTSDGDFEVSNFWYEGNCSTGADFPIEVEPGIFEFRSNTSIYRFRVFSNEDNLKAQKALEAAYDKLTRFVEEKGFPEYPITTPDMKPLS